MSCTRTMRGAGPREEGEERDVWRRNRGGSADGSGDGGLELGFGGGRGGLCEEGERRRVKDKDKERGY